MTRPCFGCAHILGVSHDFDFDAVGTITTRFDVVNVLDEKYMIRDGSGVGVGAPQFDDI